MPIDPAKRVINRQAILDGIKNLRKRGSYESFKNSNEVDMRFLYSATFTAHMLGDLSVIDADAICKHVKLCQVSFDLKCGAWVLTY